MKRIYYIVISLGEESIIETINSIYENCKFNYKIVVFIPDNFVYKLDIYKNYNNLSIIIDEKRDGIYNSMNRVLKILYNDTMINQDDYLCFLNTGDLLSKDFKDKGFINSLNNLKEKYDVFIFGHSTFIKTKIFGDLNLKSYYPPKNYTIRNVFRGKSICHQSTYIAIMFMKENKLFFKPKLSPFADLDLLLRCIRNKAVIKTYPIITTLYEGSGFSSKNVLKNSIKRFYYLLGLKEFSKKYIPDLLVFYLRIIRRFMNFVIKNLIKKY